MASCRRRVAEYFVVVGLDEASQRYDASQEIDGPTDTVEDNGPEQMELPASTDPITDISVVFAGQGERLPSGYECITTTPSQLPANLHHGSSNSNKAVYICYRRGRHNSPLTDIDLVYRSPQLVDFQVVTASIKQMRNADINHSPTSPSTYLAYRRATHTGAGSGHHYYGMALSDLCLINSSKNEPVPRGFTMVNKAIHAGLTGPTFYLCYKKTLVKPHAVAYRAAILHRFPLEDKEDFPLPKSVPLFCLPLGASVESWSDNVSYPIPTFSSFVLTGAAGEKVYGAAVVFYEELAYAKQMQQMRKALFGADAETSTQRMFCNKAICVLSRWPFFQAFKTYLSSLYRISISGPSLIPLERYISNFMLDVPFPSPSRPRVLIQLGPESVLLSQPKKSALPLCGVTHSILLRCLDTNNLLSLLALMLHEHQVILHSVRPSLLTSFGEALCSILFPFKWQCPYIPLCPLALASFIHAPMPFLVGIDSRYFDLYDPPDDCVCINLDNNTIAHSGSSKSTTWQLLPKKPAQQLGRTLRQLQTQVPLGTDLDSDLAVAVVPPPSSSNNGPKSGSPSLNMAIREAFLHFNAQIMTGYSSFLRPLTKAPSQTSTDISQLFDLQGFLKSRPSQDHPFFSKFFPTQTFSHLIEHRSFMTSDDSGTLAFFDECVANADKPEPLITVTDSDNSGMTIVANPPDLSGLEDRDYVYDTFTLDERLFCSSQSSVTGDGQGSVDGESDVSTEVSSSPHAPVSRSESSAHAVFQRTVAEREKSLQTASRSCETPASWASYLYAHVYALWFIHLPSYANLHPFKREALNMAFKTLEKMDEQRVQLPDEVSYRVLMDLCAKLGHPMLAVRVLIEMSRNKITPNAVTYAHYNKAMLDCDWPSKAHMWRTLRHVMSAICRLKMLLKEKRDGEAALNALSSADAASVEKARLRMKKSNSNLLTLPRPNSASLTPVSSDMEIAHQYDEDESVPTTPDHLHNTEPSALSAALTEQLQFANSSTPPDRNIGNGVNTPPTMVASSEGHREIVFTHRRASSATSADLASSVPITNTITEERTANAPTSRHRRRSSLGRSADAEVTNGLLAPSRNIVKGVNRRSSLSATPSLENVMTRSADRSSASNDPHASERRDGYAGSSPAISSGASSRLNISPRKGLRDGLQNLQGGVRASMTSSFRRGSSNKFSATSSNSSSTRVAHVELGTEVTAGVRITSSVRCHQCGSVLYDEQIMPKWKADDSNLNTSCCYCGKSLVAFLTIAPESYDPCDRSAAVNSIHTSPTGLRIESFFDGNDMPQRPVGEAASVEKNALPELSVPFLSPLLLRKELETLLVNDGIEVLFNSSFVDQHPGIYWNMLYFFVRLNLPTKLATLFSSSALAQKYNVTAGSVSVSLVWHLPVQTDAALPFYQRWLSRGLHHNIQSLERDELSSQLQSLAARLQCGDYHAPMAAMLKDRLTLRRSMSNLHGKSDPKHFRSIYWELLCFLAVVRGAALDLAKFDRDFSRAISRLSRDIAGELRPDDHGPDAAALAFRSRFGALGM